MKEGLVNLAGSMGLELGSSKLHASVLPTTLQTHPISYNKSLQHWEVNNSSEDFSSMSKSGLTDNSATD